ncbi:LuxR C-terminal-related transcriptional regulator [Amycolatopsis rhabdoformis]|uniref:LuxR C-terminal-related transcriptional regulator n=1 Tax=Amycolatopsis rhabdoformis TaxID=1448059 RepID=A0ABZ1I803_9PSEU|nr:LuxR C-terminal-related transcriptional regulator [Amycolatopsis rhabdoformis]WSE30003.1 LuxR C-terminal-related transcriptional regulator [Amycolatopsis rhabdoformis]
MNALLAKTGTDAVHPVARLLLAELAAATAPPARLVVVAPGGYGKTTLLGALESGCREAGVDATLVDDADQLGEEDVARLTALDGPVVLAHRPNPRSVALRGLAEPFARQVVLSALSAEEVGALARQLTGRLVDAAAAAALHSRTGGVPRLVERAVTEELGEFRAELAELDDDVLRYLIAAEAGAGRNLDLLCALLDLAPDRLPEVVDGARATGLLDANDELLPVAAEAVRTYGPPARRLTVLQRLVEIQLQGGLPVLELAKSLLDTGSSGASAAAAFATAAGEALPADAKLAARLFEAAAEAGARDSAVTTGWARAAALSGDLDTALRLGDGMLSGDDPEARAAGAEIAATVLAHRGELARSAELYRWAAAVDADSPSAHVPEVYRWAGRGAANAFASIALVGSGQLDAARALVDAPVPGMAPTLFAGAVARTASGIVDSVSGPGADTLSALVGASAMLEPAATGAPLPDSPAALAALVGLHSGELGLAESVLDRALASDVGGDLLTARHRLLLGWVAMTSGHLTAAAEHRDAVAGLRLEARDELFFATLELGLARRASDLVGLQQSWDRAYQASMRQQTDLFTLLPLGELAIAAARTGANAKLTRQLRHAHAMLADLGNPPLWTVSLCWHELHAAITVEDLDTAAHQLAALTGFAGHGRYPAALARAATCWLAVLSGTFDHDEISAAAAELHELDLCWDAARLAGQAAIRTSDRKAMVQLLEAARQFQAGTGRRESATPEPGAAPGLSTLSERELEVARLVVDGLTYKQAGSKLFISGKTVEHHMARIRAKLGATDRRELLATLRDQLAKPDLS